MDQEGNPLTSGIALGTASNIEHFSDILGLMIVQNGGDLQKLDRPEAIGALESYRKFAEPPNKVWNEDLPNSITAFAQEKVAMVIVPSWEIQVIKTLNPDIELKVTTIPSVPGAKPVSISNYWVEGVSRLSKNQIEAWKFLSFLVKKENMTKLYELQSKVRLFGEPYSRVDLGELIAQNEYIGAVIKQADNYVSIPSVSRTYDNGLNDEIVAYLENAVNATIQGVSYGEALTTAKNGVDQVLDKYQIK
ncbi:extracellular solute-binding protein [Candidatus Roizmanbacteria bacterium]|nr:extracellular solute-binding protein [Candidatus Roizmanbacteria bacterium]